MFYSGQEAFVPNVDALASPVILNQSYRNFHAKGLDYLCLKRSSEHTIKVYFFDGDADLSALPEIVMPHDHRYNFRTVCIAGEVSNLEQSRCANFSGSDRYESFLWDTPLNGGAGFRHEGEAFLTHPHRSDYRAGEAWASSFDTIHTLRIGRTGTIIRLDQYADVVPVGTPTRTYRPASVAGDIAAPELAGLYEAMTPAYAAGRMLQYRDALLRMTGNVSEPSVGMTRSGMNPESPAPTPPRSPQ